MENDKIYIKKDARTVAMGEFLKEYAAEILDAAANLDEEYSYKIFIYLFTKLYYPSKNEDSDSFSIEELCDYVKCSVEEITPSLYELSEKGYLVQELDENNEVKCFKFDISPNEGE